MTTRAPSAANNFAVASPIPEPAPVTILILLSSFPIFPFSPSTFVRASMTRFTFLVVKAFGPQGRSGPSTAARGTSANSVGTTEPALMWEVATRAARLKHRDAYGCLDQTAFAHLTLS